MCMFNFYFTLIEHTEEVEDAKKKCIKAKEKGNIPSPSTFLVVFLEDTSLEQFCVLL